MRAKLAAHHLICPRGMRASIRTEASKVEGARFLVLDMPEVAVRAKRAEATGIVWTSWFSQLAGRTDVKVCAVFTLRADTVAAVFFAFSLVAEVEGMRELARVTFLAQAALVVLADEMADAGALIRRDVVSVRAVDASWAA